jgi:hypothetical protein
MGGEGEEQNLTGEKSPHSVHCGHAFQILRETSKWGHCPQGLAVLFFQLFPFTFFFPFTSHLLHSQKEYWPPWD